MKEESLSRQSIVKPSRLPIFNSYQSSTSCRLLWCPKSLVGSFSYSFMSELQLFCCHANNDTLSVCVKNTRFAAKWVTVEWVFFTSVLTVILSQSSSCIWVSSSNVKLDVLVLLRVIHVLKRGERRTCTTCNSCSSTFSYTMIFKSPSVSPLQVPLMWM